MQRQSGRERAYDHIRRAVLTTPAWSGTFLNEQDLAAEIGVSRTPVREALLMLATEGLVELIPNRGVLVPALTGQQLTELISLRGVLERHAAAETLRLGRTPTAAMRECLAAQERLAGVSGVETEVEFIGWDNEFHQQLIDGVGSQLLSETYATLRARQRRAGLAAVQGSVERRDQVCGEHRAIVEALDAGDADAVRAAIDHHLSLTLATLLGG